MFKKILITIVSTVLLLAFIGGYGMYWLQGVMPSDAQLKKIKMSQAVDIPYLQKSTLVDRGKILAVVTSIGKIGDTGKNTGYELTELARAYWVFKANGFDVDIASIKGGTPPIVIDGDDMTEFDYAFLNNTYAQKKVTHTLVIDQVNPDDYEAVYFVGGKGAMFDFPDNLAIKNIINHMHRNGKVISAVCHGPAALVNAQLDSGEWLIANKLISGFTNEEELFLIPDAANVFPFLLQSKLSEQGAKFDQGLMYLENISHDGKVITGQNPWSVWALAEAIVTELGYRPIERVKTAEENSVELLAIYKTLGYQKAKLHLQNHPVKYQGFLIVMHAIVAFMQMELVQGIGLLFLTNVVITR